MESDKHKYSGIFSAKVNNYNRITVPKNTVNIFDLRPGDTVTLAILSVVRKGEVIELNDLNENVEDDDISIQKDEKIDDKKKR